jgi:hypothetical protein
MKKTPQTIGALQAVGLVAYVVFVASVIQTVASVFPNSKVPNPILGASLFLLLFVTSALISGSIALGYPIVLFFIKDKRGEALETVGWTIGWLILIGIFFALYLFLSSSFY